MAVGAVLADDEVRPERRRERRHDRPHRREPGHLTGHRLERDVDDGPRRGALPDLVLGPGPREEIPTGFVERDRQHPGIVAVDRLHAVAVVDVEVHVEDPEPGPSRRRHGQRDVVVDAEPGGPLGHRVVKAAARMVGMLDLSADDRFDRPDGAAGHGRGGLVHPGERRHVPERGDPIRRGGGRVLREPADRREIPLRVDGEELGVGGRLGGQPGSRPDRPQEVDARAEPARRQRMARPEVVVAGPWTVDEQRAVAGSGVRHASHDTGGGTMTPWEWTPSSSSSS